MTVEYQLEPADFLAFAEERRRFMPRKYSQLYYYVVLPMLSVGLALSIQSFPVAIIFTLLFAVSGWLVSEQIQRSYRNTVYTEENLSLHISRWTASIKDEGMQFSCNAAEVFYRWSAIKRVVHSSRYVHFEMSPLHRVNIPIRCFRDEDHVKNFLNAAKAHVP
jgi:hypothetical protein